METKRDQGLKAALEALLHDSIERRIGEHDTMRCKVCGAEGHNELSTSIYGIKHKDGCSVVSGWEAALAASEPGPSLQQPSMTVAGWGLPHEENWDGYGGLPISAEVERNAVELWSMFQAKPEPTPNGTVTFESERGAIEIGKTRVSGYFGDDANRIFFDGTLAQPAEPRLIKGCCSIHGMFTTYGGKCPHCKAQAEAGQPRTATPIAERHQQTRELLDKATAEAKMGPFAERSAPTAVYTYQCDEGHETEVELVATDAPPTVECHGCGKEAKLVAGRSQPAGTKGDRG